MKAPKGSEDAIQEAKRLTNASAYQVKKYLDLATALHLRKVEALNLYEPMPWQEKYHACRTKEVIVRKANQAGGAQPLDSKVLTPFGWRRFGDLQPGDQVIGGNGEPCNVLSIHPQGWKPIFRLTFDDRSSMLCTECHAWKCQLTSTEKFKSHKNYKPNKWRVATLREIREHGGDDPKPWDKAIIPVAAVQHPYRPVPIAPYTLGALLGDGSFSQDTVSLTSMDPWIPERIISELPKGMSHRVKPNEGSQCMTWFFLGGSNRDNPLMTGLRQIGLMGHKGEAKFIPDEYLFNSRDVRLALLQGLMDTDGYCDSRNGCPYFYTSSPRLAQGVVDLVKSLGGKAYIHWKETSITLKKKKCGRPFEKRACGTQSELFNKHGDASRAPCLNMAEVRITVDPDVPLFSLPRKQQRRCRFRGVRNNGRVLQKIRAEGNAECMCIKVDSPDHTYITEDYIVTHNSLVGFVEDARAVTNQDPYKKYPKEGVLVCLGYGEKHIGRVIHRYLFRPGAFRIIRDRETQEWRTYRPWPREQTVNGKEGDEDRKDDAKPAPPLIPKRFIEKFSWDKRSEYIFSYVKLTTGWEIIAANTAGEASQAQGFQADLVHIDEDTASPGWYQEMVGRLSIREGLLRWTALPHAQNDELMSMLLRAEEQYGMDNPTTTLITATMFDNIYYPQKSREENIRIWKSEGDDVYRKRALGEIVVDSIRMYPTFSKDLHDAIKTEEPRTKVQQVLTERNGVPPNEWTRYMVIDPGHTVCAVLFFAVPPPDFGDHCICYRELYLRQCDAAMFGTMIEQVMAEEYVLFQSFIIDAHGGRLGEIASGITPRKRYSDELKKRNIQSVDTKYEFRDGSDDLAGRETCVRDWLHIRRDGTTKLMIVVSRCPNLVREMNGFMKLTTRIGGRDVPTDKGNRRSNTHAVECLEYMAAHGALYVRPKDKVKKETHVDRVIRQRKEREAARRAKTTGRGRNTISLGPRGS